MDLSFDRKTFSGWAPLFPLPNVVLLPGGMLPLHVFEPRYRIMLADSLAGEKLIAMAHLLPGFEQEYHEGCPKIHPWVGLGRIVAHESLPDGRSNLVLAGLRRAQVVEEDRSKPYRRARLEVSEDEEPPESERDQLRLRVLRALEALPESLVRNPVQLSVSRRIAVPLGAFVDLAADALALEAEERLAILSEPSARARAIKLASIVEARAGVPGGERRWPPGFSRN